jgi:hypothetical protein
MFGEVIGVAVSLFFYYCLFVLQDLPGVIARSRTNHTQNHGIAVVYLTPRSGFMM